MKYIDYSIKKLTDRLVPRLYEMPKKGNPLRMIVLSPLYPLAFFLKISLTKILKKDLDTLKTAGN